MVKSKSISLKAQPAKGKGKSEKEVLLIIQGDLTIANASQLKDFLLTNLNKFDSFIVKISNIDGIDLPTVQLLQGFQWDILRANKSVEYSIKISDENRLLLLRAGLNAFVTLIN